VKRQDVIKEYGDYLHEIVCLMIKNFWDIYFEKLEVPMILQLTNWLHNYKENIKCFLQDERLEQAVSTLLSVFLQKSIENAEPLINGIIEFEKNNRNPS
jgi:hypothetical protein